MKSKKIYPSSIPDNILYEEHEPIAFKDFIAPALHFDMKAYRKRLAREKEERKLLKELKKTKKK